MPARRTGPATAIPMSSYNTSEFRSGLKILLDNDPYTIVENEFVKPGKGQAFNRVRIKNLRTGRVIDETWNSGERIAEVRLERQAVQFLYAAGVDYHFMNTESFDQLMIPKERMGDAVAFLKDGTTLDLVMREHEIVTIEFPQMVELEVVETEPGIRGDTAGTGGKTAKLETGAVVRVPLFIEVGEKLKLDTRTGEYVGRVK